MAVLWFFSVTVMTIFNTRSHSILFFPGLGERPILYTDSYLHVSHITKMLEGWVFIMGSSESWVSYDE